MKENGYGNGRITVIGTSPNPTVTKNIVGSLKSPLI
jgi:hypothetical protein